MLSTARVFSALITRAPGVVLVCSSALVATAAGAAPSAPPGATQGTGTTAVDPIASLRAALSLDAADVRTARSVLAASQARGSTRASPFSAFERTGEVARSGFVAVQVNDAGTGPLDTPRAARAHARVAPSIRLTPLPERGVHSVRVPRGWTEETLAEFLMATGDYAFVEPDWLVRPALTPNDPLFSQQYHHASGHLNTVRAWDFTTGDPDMIVAFVDSGIDVDHPDLLNRVEGYNSADRLTESQGGQIADVNGHGSEVAGAGAARGNNAVGVSGMGWNFRIMPVRTTNNTNGTAPLSDLTHGANWAADNGAKVVSVSYSGVSASQVGQAGLSLRNKGSLLVWAAGNEGAPSVTANHASVTIVGATGVNGQRASLSNYGPGLDILAPGVEVRTTNRFGGYVYSTGTSFACPLVAGGLALIWSANPDLTPAQVEQVLFDTATDLGATGRDDFHGFGRANIGAAVEAAFTGEITFPVPLTVNFDTGTLDPVLWPTQQSAVPSQNAAAEPSGAWSLRLDPGALVETALLDASGAAPGSLTLRAALQGGIAPAGSVAIQYLNNNATWTNLLVLFGDEISAQAFRFVERTLPADALHAGLRLRIAASGNTGPVYLDDLRLDAFANIRPSWLESFERAAEPEWWPTFDADIVTTTPGTPSGTGSARLAQGDTIETATILTKTVLVGLAGVNGKISYWVRPGAVEAADALIVEYFDPLTSTWDVLDTITAGDLPATGFSLRQFTVPLDMIFFLDSKIRFRANVNNADDAWFLDNIYVGVETFTQPPACPADLTGDGIADSGDLAVFINAFLVQSTLADFTLDGQVDSGDLQAFIEAFLTGC
jgi:subtilisin family serine protease